MRAFKLSSRAIHRQSYRALSTCHVCRIEKLNLDTSHEISNEIIASSQSSSGSNASNVLPHSWQAQHPAQGLSAGRFMPETEAVLLGPVDPDDVEIRPEGFPYLAVNTYRAILNKAFGPGAWGLQPLGPLTTEGDDTFREYQLWAHGRPIAQSRGETSATNIVKTAHTSASETVKSDALKRCAKDLGIGIELSKKSWIRQFKAEHCYEVWLKNTKGGPSKKIWRRKDAGPYEVYPWVEESIVGVKPQSAPQAHSSSTTSFQTTPSIKPAITQTTPARPTYAKRYTPKPSI